MNDVEAIAALQDPVRRRLYDYVAAQGHAVGRAEAADAAGIQRTLAAFHLDRLAEAGLLDVVFRRPPGRGGPGAGRPAKLYRRAAGEHAVSVPPRDYRTAARLLAETVEAVGAEAELERIARARGRTAGAAMVSAAGRGAPPQQAGGRFGADGAADPGPAGGPSVPAASGQDPAASPAGTAPAPGRSPGARTAGDDPAGEIAVGAEPGAREATGAGRASGTEPAAGEPAGGAPSAADSGGSAVVAALAARGYEPYRDGGVLRLRNCPFHALATEFPPMVCGMNLAWFEGFVDGAGAETVVARMDPRPGECCVTLVSKNNDS